MEKKFRELYRQDDLPIFQNRMYPSYEEARACPKGRMRLVEDLSSGLVHNMAFDPSLVDYDENYQNEQSKSTLFRAHMNAVADLIQKKMGGDNLVEVGCGKGAFVDILSARGIDITGFDPAYEGNNVRIKKTYFSHDLRICARGLILRHVLEHIQNPVDFLQQLAVANGKQGLIYIEVPCFEWICRRKAWYDIFYEHVNYFRIRDFQKIFGRLIHADHAFGGQYLRIIGDLSTIQVPVYDDRDAVEFPARFDQLLAQAIAVWNTGPVVVWGGASKGVIFTLLLERAGGRVSRVIDINPAKQGRFLPGTGLQVLSPEDGLSDLPDGVTILVMNPNYLDEIRMMAGPRFTYRTLGDE